MGSQRGDNPLTPKVTVYLRSSAIWSFDLEQDTCHIPIGLGVGKVWLNR